MVTIKSRKLQFRFAQWCGESFYFTSIVRGIMETTKIISKMQSILLTLTLMVAALGVGSAAVAAEMVKDPSTGEMVEAPRYGGTLTYATAGANWNFGTPITAGQTRKTHGRCGEAGYRQLGSLQRRMGLEIGTPDPHVCPHRETGGKLGNTRRQNDDLPHPSRRALA